jgi:predicted nucleic acid-binding protein
MKLPAFLSGCEGVVIDTNVFIYLYEDHAEFAGIAEFIVNEAEAGSFAGLITPITISEIVVKPYAMQRPDLADISVRALRSYRNIHCIDIDAKTAQMAGALRAKYRRPLPDMYQAAIALTTPCPILITNDKLLKNITEIQIYTMQDFI